jgi:hypothetical protein
MHVTIEPTTGLSPAYMIVICFDNNYPGLSKQEVQEAAASRFEMMNIPLAPRYHEPISTIVDKESSQWLGFLRVDLLNPQVDGLALLRDDQVFTLYLRHEYVIGKVEKGFDFCSISTNRKLKI